MAQMRASMVGVDISPRFQPQFGARGTTPRMTKLHRPLLARCLVLDQDGRRLIWFGGDLNGEPLPFTDALRDELAGRLNVPRSRIAWSSSQSHACGALPGSVMAGSHIEKLVADDAEFTESERQRFFKDLVNAAREGIETLQPVRLQAGRGHCDSIGYNSRFPMPAGGCKFSRDYAEALQGGKFHDPTIGLLRFEEARRMLDAGESPRTQLDLTLGAVRIGDAAAALSPGENFTVTGDRVRRRSPFVHTLVCGDTNGLFGYMGTDEEIERGGFETDTFWKILEFEGLRLPPAKGTAQRVVNALVGMLEELRGGRRIEH